MKKITMLMMLLVLMVQSICAKTVSEIIQDYRNENKAEYTYVSPAMMLMLKAAVKKYTGEYTSLVDKIDCARILKLDACKQKTKKKLFKEIDKLDEEEYQPVVMNGQKWEGFKVLVKVGTDSNSEFVVVDSGNGKCTLMQVEGNITLQELQKILTDKKLPGLDK